MFLSIFPKFRYFPIQQEKNEKYRNFEKTLEQKKTKNTQPPLRSTLLVPENRTCGPGREKGSQRGDQNITSKYIYIYEKKMAISTDREQRERPVTKVEDNLAPAWRTTPRIATRGADW